MKIKSMRERLLASSMICGTAIAAFAGAPAFAQDTVVQEIVVTGSRIQVPGLQSASPIVTVGAEEIRLQATPEAEKIIRLLPIAVPSDGENVNNGTAGVSTVNLRGMGPQRNLIMMDGKRMTPYDENGRVDVSNVPTAMLERADVITGGASAVYGSDAISGAINFILKRDFEGLEADFGYSQTNHDDGQVYNASVTMGANVADGRGNVTLGLNYSKREGVQLGARPFGQVGVVTATGQNLGATSPPAAPAGCQGPGSVASGGSTTTLPTRIAIAGGPGLGQFRDDGSIGANCSVFNFNPFNYYQTPQERYGGTAIAHYDVTDNVEAYSRLTFSATTVRQQVAASGIFGESFFTPLANPFLAPSALNTILTRANAGVAAGTVVAGGNWHDVNANGAVDTADDLLLQYRRRAVELGERSTTYDSSYYQIVTGVRGTLLDNWNWDLSFSRGESKRTSLNAGYTNVSNFENAVNAVSTTTCRTGGDACVPVNVFGGYGSITPAMAAYIGATALQKQTYVQQIANFNIGGQIEALKSPWASEAVAVSVGTEYREENAESIPDECLKLAPTSCLGGAGGNTLPIVGGFSVQEFFGEAIVPIAMDQPFAKSLTLELGYRYSDYDPTGVNRTWKAGFNWEPMDGLLIRVMQQRAARAPNVAELASPLVTGLRNANLDPCSIENAAALAGNATLTARCISTGMTAAQVGTVQDIVSGQISTFEGTDLVNLPKPETADTTTVGFVWRPTFIPAVKSPVLTVDWYKIDIQDTIGIYSPQEILDGCYIAARPSDCAKVVRVNGDLASPASGIRLYTTNLKSLKVEGVEINAGFGLDLETLGLDPKYGSLAFQWTGNIYTKNESQSSDLNPVQDCLGYYGTGCGTNTRSNGPAHEFRFIQRTTWDMGPMSLSYLWRYQDEVKVSPDQLTSTYAAFQKIKAHSYLDLSGSYAVNDAVKISASVKNAFNKQPPIVGNEAGTPSANSGNTFPSNYDTLGRVYSVGLNLRF